MTRKKRHKSASFRAGGGGCYSSKVHMNQMKPGVMSLIWRKCFFDRNLYIKAKLLQCDALVVKQTVQYWQTRLAHCTPVLSWEAGWIR